MKHYNYDSWSTLFRCGADKLSVGNSGTEHIEEISCPNCRLAIEKMYCPVCRSTLCVSEDKRVYETLLEHVSEPNAVIPPRNVLVCPNPYCECAKQKVFWSAVYTEMGDGPYNSFRGNGIQWIDENPHPFNSHFRRIYFNYDYKLEDKTFSLFGLTIKKNVRYTSNMAGDKVGRHCYYDIIINNSYWTPWPAKLSRFLHTFNSKVKSDISSDERNSLVRSFGMSNPEDPFWLKLARSWIRLFHGVPNAKSLH